MRYRNLLLSIFGGLMAGLAFPNFLFTGMNWWGGVLAYGCLIPLLAIREERAFPASWRWGFIYGFIYFGLAIIWMVPMKAMHPLGPLAWFGLTGYLALYPAVFILVYHFLLKGGVPAWWAAAPLWVGLEFIRNYGLSGFPWVCLGYAHHQSTGLMALAPVTGVWGLSLITVLANSAGHYILGRWFPGWAGQESIIPKTIPLRKFTIKGRLLAWGLLLVLISGGVVYEKVKLRRHPGSAPVTVAALQGNIDQDQVWDQEYQRTTLDRYHELINQAADQGARIVIWPETAFPGIFNLDGNLADYVRRWSQAWGICQLLGSDKVEPGGRGNYRYFNSVILIEPSGKVGQVTSKVHLVPFGEYIPFKHTIFYFLHKVVKRYVGEGFTPGRKRRLLVCPSEGKKISFGALICFESIFPGYTAKLARRGAEILVVITNDKWFGMTAAPAQHAVFSALRAAETGRYLIRVAACGISGIYNSRGKLIKSLPLNHAGVLVTDVRPRTTLTSYTVYGDWLPWLCLVILAGELMACIIRRKKTLAV